MDSSGAKPNVLHQRGEKSLSALQNRLEIERGKKEREHTLPSLPFHSIEYAPEQTDIWVMLHSLKRVKWITDRFLRPPTLAPSPSLTYCTLECQTSSLSDKSAVCQLMGHWREEASKILNLSSVNVYMRPCLYLCLLAVLLAASLFNTAADSQTKINQYSFAWIWPTYSVLRPMAAFQNQCVYRHICLVVRLYTFLYISV